MWNVLLGVPAGTAWGPSLTAPLNEELLKLAGVVILAVAAPSALRGPVDGFILGALVGLGFQVVENALYALNTVVLQGATAGGVSVLVSLALRIVVTGAGSHWAMTAIAGTAVGLLAAARWRPGPRRAWAAGLLVLFAMALHGFFNAPVLSSLPGAVAKTAVVFTSALLVYLVVRAGYRRRVRNALEAEGAAVDLHRSDARELATRHGRRAALHRIPAPDRPTAARRQLRLLKAAERKAAEPPRHRAEGPPAGSGVPFSGRSGRVVGCGPITPPAPVFGGAAPSAPPRTRHGPHGGGRRAPRAAGPQPCTAVVSGMEEGSRTPPGPSCGVSAARTAARRGLGVRGGSRNRCRTGPMPERKSVAPGGPAGQHPVADPDGAHPCETRPARYLRQCPGVDGAKASACSSDPASAPATLGGVRRCPHDREDVRERCGARVPSAAARAGADRAVRGGGGEPAAGRSTRPMSPNAATGSANPAAADRHGEGALRERGHLGVALLEGGAADAPLLGRRAGRAGIGPDGSAPRACPRCALRAARRVVAPDVGHPVVRSDRGGAEQRPVHPAGHRLVALGALRPAPALVAVPGPEPAGVGDTGGHRAPRFSGPRPLRGPPAPMPSAPEALPCRPGEGSSRCTARRTGLPPRE
ncbi:PrsW family glutamic-type intramembrane protease [Nocardiopsis composta]